jgi:hypothetical protein
MNAHVIPVTVKDIRQALQEKNAIAAMEQGNR